MNAKTLRDELRTLANPDIAAHSQRFFRTESGGYGEGDRFLGIRVPVVRKVAKTGRGLPLKGIATLLHSRWHEERQLALVIMVERFKKADEDQQHQLHTLYLDNISHVNNWDLVDLTAPWLVGAWLTDRDRSLIHQMAKSEHLWIQRIAVMSTFAFIRANDFHDTLTLAKQLLHHEHDLMHKAVGWMLREVGNRDRAVEETFLADHYHTMPRTMLRYAIEKFPEPLRLDYLKGRA
jgi:3-methyladenine DNA glycosylase AlkD